MTEEEGEGGGVRVRASSAWPPKVKPLGTFRLAPGDLHHFGVNPVSESDFSDQQATINEDCISWGPIRR